MKSFPGYSHHKIFKQVRCWEKRSDTWDPKEKALHITTYTPGKPLGECVCVHTCAGVGDPTPFSRCRQRLSPEGCGWVRASTGSVPPSQSDPSLRTKDTSDQARKNTPSPAWEKEQSSSGLSNQKGCHPDTHSSKLPGCELIRFSLRVSRKSRFLEEGAKATPEETSGQAAQSASLAHWSGSVGPPASSSLLAAPGAGSSSFLYHPRSRRWHPGSLDSGSCSLYLAPALK